MDISTNQLIKFVNKLNILYVEDDNDTREYVLELLSFYSDNVVSASDGKEALERFNSTKFDIVISDIKMPKMSGVELAKNIKEKSPSIPVIMVTAYQEAEYLLDCIKCSVDGYILKPITAQKIEDVLLKVAEKLYCDWKNDEYEAHLEELVKARTLELELAQEALIDMANKDPMTGLYNRRYFNEISSTLLQLAKRNSQSLSLLMIDIDRFKVINDNYGHLVGDEIIKELANIFMELTRESDIVVRFGGEEFLILLPDTDISGAALIAKKIRETVYSSELIIEDGSVIKCTISIGVASCDCVVDTNIDSLVHTADEALYAAKKSGRNTVVQYKKETL
jgi:diguanylate cyclase (GGDEF)-like protein